MSEKNPVPLADEEVYRRFMRLPVFLCVAIAGAAAYLDVLPKGLIGGMGLLLPLGLLLERVGARIPVLVERDIEISQKTLGERTNDSAPKP